MSNRKVSYAGIPAKERARVKRLMNLYAGGLDVLTGVPKAPKTPQEVWANLTAHWKNKREEEEKKAADAENERIARIKEIALDRLKHALEVFHSALSIAQAIENDQADYFEHQDLGRFLRLCINEGGQDLERALCDLGVIPEDDCPRFVDGELKSNWLKAPTEEDDEEEQGEAVA